MKFRIVFTEKARKQLKKLDNYEALLIIGWLRKNLEGCENPRSKGKGLVGNHGGEWRYRVGNYRIIADIQDDKVIILLLEIGHRRDIY